MIALLIIFIGLLLACLIGDYIIPHIPFIENYLENLPNLETETAEVLQKRSQAEQPAVAGNHQLKQAEIIT